MQEDLEKEKSRVLSIKMTHTIKISNIKVQVSKIKFKKKEPNEKLLKKDAKIDSFKQCEMKVGKCDKILH